MQICSGCGTICDPKEKDCYAISSTVDTYTGITCLSGYYFDNGVCATCLKNCLICSNSITC